MVRSGGGGPNIDNPEQLLVAVVLIAIVAAISLTMRKRPGLKLQNIAKQVAVRSQDRVRIVKMDATRPEAPASPDVASQEKKP